MLGNTRSKSKEEVQSQRLFYESLKTKSVHLQSCQSLQRPNIRLLVHREQSTTTVELCEGFDLYSSCLLTLLAQCSNPNIITSSSRPRPIRGIICIEMTNKLSSPKIPSLMAEPNIQLLLTADSITVNASMFEGVLTKKTFEGPDCYLKLVDFLKQSSFANQVIHAVIVVS